MRSVRKFQLFLVMMLGSITSAAMAQGTDTPHIVMLIAEREYETEKSLPQYAKTHLADYRVSFVYADPQDRNRFEGVEAVSEADLLFISVRRRTLPRLQLDMIRDYVRAGKPVIGIRTASHAFCLRNQKPPEGKADWPEFDAEVFGGNYTNHHGNDLKAVISFSVSRDGTLSKGLNVDRMFTSGGSLYRVSPLHPRTQVLMTGKISGLPSEPVAWVYRREDGGRSFYTSLGHVDDFAGVTLPTLLNNATSWCLREN